jgi:SAM-dependent methyltransferase
MSYKQRVPVVSDSWDTYWQQTSIDRELTIAATDGLKPIFRKYLKKTWTCLEAGCGLGKWVINLAREGYQIIGLDTYVKGLVKLKAYDPGLELMAGDVAKLGLKDNSLDAYISLGVVEHFEEGPQVPLAEAYRTVKKGKLAFIEVPYDSPLRQITRGLFQLKVLIKTPIRLLVEGLHLRPKRPTTPYKFYEYRYTREELAGFVTQAGFEIIELLPKDDLDHQKSIALWLDYPFFHHADGQIFHLNAKGQIAKKILNLITPFTYSALIVAVCTKP